MPPAAGMLATKSNPWQGGISIFLKGRRTASVIITKEAPNYRAE
ncbi:MAG: hypothetical protein WBL61_25875 [Bryobacteraceae bacterium]